MIALVLFWLAMLITFLATFDTNGGGGNEVIRPAMFSLL